MARVLAVALTIMLCAVAGANKPPSAEARKQAKAHSAQGLAHQAAGKYDDAIKDYQEAYALAPLPLLLFNIGLANQLKGDKREAMSWYEKYLAADPDGRASAEAQERISTMKLELLVAEAEASRKAAAEEAAAARLRAEQAEASRQHAVDEEVARQRRAVEEQARLRKQAEADEQAARAKWLAAGEARRQRLEAAHRVGYALRVVGGVVIALGVVTAAGLTWITVADGDGQKDKISTAGSKGMWSVSADNAIARQKTDTTADIALLATGGALIVVGTTLAIVGTRLRTKAERRAQSLAVAPLLSPSLAGFAVGGRF